MPSSAFFKHYLSIIERPVQTVAVPGGVLGELAEDENDEDPVVVSSDE